MSDTSLAQYDEKAIARQQVRETSVSKIPDNLAEVIEIAKVMAASGFYQDAKTAQQAAAIMIIGIQFGIPPAQALSSVYIVKGKPMLAYPALLSKVRQHPEYDYEIVETTDKVARIQWLRKGKPCGESVFTIEQAKKQGTQNIDKFPDTMLLARAVSNGVKRYCPDVVNGMPVYTPGEIIDDETQAEIPRATRGDTLRAEMLAEAEVAAEALVVHGVDVVDDIPDDRYRYDDQGNQIDDPAEVARRREERLAREKQEGQEQLL